MLYQIGKKNGILLHPEAIKLVPEFAKLDVKQVLFLVLSKDYTSPFHQFPEDDRIRKAKRRVYNSDTLMPEKVPLMVEAMRMYDVLQYDSKRNMLNIYEGKIENLSKKMAREEDETKLKRIDDAIQMLIKRIADLQRQVESNEEERVIKGGGEISFIEQWQENMRNEKKQVKADPDATAEI